jgi:hypothetical protein
MSPTEMRSAAWLLKNAGLPSTPATVRHLLACVAGLSEPLPSYGLLVTTRVFVSVAGDKIATDPMPDSTISGDTAFVRTAILERAQAIVLTHRDFVKREATHPLTDVRAERRAQAEIYNGWRERQTSDGDDYVAAALNGARELTQMIRAGGPINPTTGRDRVREHLDRFSRAWYQRRRRAERKGKVVPPLPENWRRIVEPELRRLVS